MDNNQTMAFIGRGIIINSATAMTPRSLLSQQFSNRSDIRDGRWQISTIIV